MRSGTEFQVDLSLLSENFDLLRNLAPTNKVIFMVKANAYGHGLLEISKYACENLEISCLGVASLGEALFLKKHLPKLKCELWTFSDTEIMNADVHEQYYCHGIIPVLSSLAQLEFILSCSMHTKIPIVLKFDTGMHRLGISCDQIDAVLSLLNKYKIKKIKHIMTHFMSSYIKLKKGDRTHRQYEKFLKLKEKFHGANIEVLESSCANSGAIEQKFALDESHIRPGLMLYGPRSVGSFRNQEEEEEQEVSWQGKSISSLRSKIIKIMPIKKGEPIGYGGHICHADGTVIFLPIGYGDGILTFYTGLQIHYKSFGGQIIGRVNMDLIAVFFINKNPEDFALGDDVLIWDHDQHSVVDLATQVRTIPYQVYTAITDRVPKHYI